MFQPIFNFLASLNRKCLKLIHACVGLSRGRSSGHPTGPFLRLPRGRHRLRHEKNSPETDAEAHGSAFNLVLILFSITIMSNNVSVVKCRNKTNNLPMVLSKTTIMIKR
jgi:hypothetical protein